MKTGLVLEGGGTRGIFTSGVLDLFIKENIHFDYVVGVSAGAINTYSFLAEKEGFYKKVSEDKDGETIYGTKELIDSGKFINFEKLFKHFAKKYDLDLSKIMNSKTEWEVVCSNLRSGKPNYFCERKDLRRLRKIATASCSLPLICDIVFLDGGFYLDGGIVDSTPIQRAIDKGCDRIIVVCTRRKGKSPSTPFWQQELTKTTYKKYPRFIEASLNREKMYKKQQKLINDLVDDGKVLVLRPEIEEIGRLEQDSNKINSFYEHGYNQALDRLEEIKNFIKETK